MSQGKTEMPQGWIQMPKIEGETKISHYFKGDNSVCAEVDLPKDGVVNDSPSIRCEKCIEKIGGSEERNKDDQDDEGPKEANQDDNDKQDEEVTQEKPQGHHTVGTISSPGSG